MKKNKLNKFYIIFILFFLMLLIIIPTFYIKADINNNYNIKTKKIYTVFDIVKLKNEENLYQITIQSQNKVVYNENLKVIIRIDKNVDINRFNNKNKWRRK